MSRRSGQIQRNVTVLGFDPGSNTTGWGLIRVSGRTFRALDFGTIRLKGKALPERLLSLFAQVEHSVRSANPDLVAIERVFWNPKLPGALVLAHARGVIVLAAARAKKPLVEPEARVVKRTVAFSGAAKKPEVLRAVARLFGLPPKLLSPDAADALAVAFTAALLSPIRKPPPL